MELILLIIFSIIIRLLFTLSPTSDTGMHLWFIKQEKLSNLGCHDMYSSIIDGVQGYPTLGHRIISYFPKSSWIFFGYVFNIFWDILYIISIYFISNYIIFNTSLDALYLEFSPGFIIAILTSISPVLVPLNARIKSIGSRTFGNLFILFNFYILYLILINGFDIFLIFLYGLSLLVILLTSQFALQAVIFFTTLISIYYQDYLVLVNMIIIFIVLYTFNILGSKHVVNHKINHWIWFFNNQDKGTVASHRNKLIDIILLPYYLLMKRNKFLEIILKQSSILILLYSIPQLFFLLSELDVILDFVKQSFLLEYITVLVVATMAVFVLTSLKPFLFLGQAERYFEYTAFIINIFFFSYCIETNNTHYLIYAFLFHLIVICAFFIYANRISYINNITEHLDKNFVDLIQYLNKLRKKRLVVIPTKIAYEIGKSIDQTKDIKLYYPFVSTKNKINGMKYMADDEQSLYYIKTNIKNFIDKYSITHVLLVKNDIPEVYSNEYVTSLEKYKVVYENKSYIIYDID